jgi:hypothetical protein
MPNGPINGRTIDGGTIDGGTRLLTIDTDMSLSLNQTAQMTREAFLDPYAIMTFTQALSELTRARLIATDETVQFNQAVLEQIRTRIVSIDGIVQVNSDVVVDVLPAVAIDHAIVFGSDCAIDHVFFGHWNDGTRMTVPAEDRTIRVPADNRKMIVPPDPDELVPQKGRKVSA